MNKWTEIIGLIIIMSWSRWNKWIEVTSPCSAKKYIVVTVHFVIQINLYSNNFSFKLQY